MYAIYVLMIMFLTNIFIVAFYFCFNSLISVEWLFLSLSNFLNFNFEMQNYNSVFLTLVCGISGMIYMYCAYYMGNSKENKMFSWILLYFVFSMLILLSSSSILNYMLGWDGLGVSSFLLVIFYKNLISTRSGLATFITNRLGDFLVIMSFVLMTSNNLLEQHSAVNLTLHSDSAPFASMQLPIMLLILGCMTKSAQLPFSAWLPAAMAAPTPISALVHSSTLVTAGIFLIYKFNLMLDFTVLSSNMMMALGILLSILAGFMAYYENDFKKLIAMSTLSQLGILVFTLFSKNYENCMFHLLSHATFKSLLFLTAGSIIMFNLGAQDMRIINMPSAMMMTPMILFISSSMSLTGFIFTSGFFSKDMIILDFFSSGNIFVLHVLLIFSCVMTALYTFKSFILVFNTFTNSNSSCGSYYNMNLQMPCAVVFLLTSYFGLLVSSILFEKEDYILEEMNKIMGVIIIALGMLMIRMSCAPSLNMMMDPAVSNSNKMAMEYINSMFNMGWLSNNFISSKLKSTSMALQTEMMWWEYLTEKLALNTQNMFKKPFIKNTYTPSIMAVQYASIIFILVYVNLMIF